MAAKLEATLDDPPIDAATLRAARRFLALVGERSPVREADLFGSRARGAAVVDMAGVAFDVMMDLDVHVEATPLWEEESDDAEGRLTRHLVRDIRRDGIRL